MIGSDVHPALSSEADQLTIRGSELCWLPRGKITESGLDLKTVEQALGPMTLRTRRTLERIATRFLSD